MAPYMIQEIIKRYYWYTYICCVVFPQIYAKLTNSRALRGGSIKKSKELKTRMKMVKKRSDLQGSEYLLTSVIPSSWPLLEDASSNWSVGHVKNPYAIPVKAAPKCVLHAPTAFKFQKQHINFNHSIKNFEMIFVLLVNCACNRSLDISRAR